MDRVSVGTAITEEQLTFIGNFVNNVLDKEGQLPRFLVSFVASIALAACGSSVEPEPIEPDTVIIGVNFVGVSVSDLERAEEYYSNSVDLKRAGESEWRAGFGPMGVGGDARSILMRSANAQLRVWQFDQIADTHSAVPVNGPGIAHVCFQMDQATGAYRKILAAGAQTMGDPDLVQLNDKNPVYYAYVKDADGIISEIEEINVAKLNLPEPPKNQYRIRHVSLATPEMDRLIEFYSAFLGGQEPRQAGSFLKLSGDKVDAVSGLPESEIEMAWFQVRNLELEIIQYHSHPTETPSEPRPIDAPGYNMIVFDVSDIASASQRLADAGGTLEGEVTEMDGGLIQFGRDPDGNLLGLQVVAADATVSSQNFADNGF